MPPCGKTSFRSSSGLCGPMRRQSDGTREPARQAAHGPIWKPSWMPSVSRLLSTASITRRSSPQALQTEWQGRYQRGIEARLRQARLPWIKTLDQFDFDFQPSLDRRQVRELAGLSFVERAHNVIILGPPGLGKNH